MLRSETDLNIRTEVIYQIRAVAKSVLRFLEWRKKVG